MRERLPAGATNDWHDHGDREAYGALFEGRLRIEYVTGDGDGDEGGDGDGAVTADAGEYVRLPARLWHRERAAGYVEWGTGEGERSLARAGDSFHVPAGLVHRDVNPEDAPQDYLVWLVGSDPRTVLVDGPGPVGSD